MDGYAIRFADMPGPMAAGRQYRGGLSGLRASGIAPGETMRIFTGAPLPEGADTVLDSRRCVCFGCDISHAHRLRPRRAWSACPRSRQRFCRKAQQLADHGTRVTPALIALAAIAGHASLTVGRAPRVALISTGDELVDPGAPLASGQIPDSNTPMLTAMLAGAPAALGTVQRIGDDRAATVEAIRAASADHDVIVTLGGASVGDHDHIHAAMMSLGAPPAFWKIAMRPGKPLLAGRVGEAVLLGLPGNPASAFVTAHLFLLPLLRHLAGAGAPLPDIGYGVLTSDLGRGRATPRLSARNRCQWPHYPVRGAGQRHGHHPRRRQRAAHPRSRRKIPSRRHPSTIYRALNKAGPQGLDVTCFVL